VDGKEVGSPANLAGNMPLGSVQLAEGEHSVTFKIVAAAKEGEPVKIRLNQLVLMPSSAAGRRRRNRRRRRQATRLRRPTDDSLEPEARARPTHGSSDDLRS